jgi:hypothetical protein
MPEQTPTTGSNSPTEASTRFRDTVRSIFSTSRQSVQPQSAVEDPAELEGDPPTLNAVSDTQSTNKPRSSRLSKWLQGWRGPRETATSNPDDNRDSRIRNNDKRAYVCETDAKGQEIPGTEVRAAYPNAITPTPSKASHAHPQEKGKRRDPNNHYCFDYER